MLFPKDPNCKYQFDPLLITLNFSLREPNVENQIDNLDSSALISFLEEIQTDYQESSSQFHAALHKFSK